MHVVREAGVWATTGPQLSAHRLVRAALDPRTETMARHADLGELPHASERRDTGSLYVRRC